MVELAPVLTDRCLRVFLHPLKDNCARVLLSTIGWDLWIRTRRNTALRIWKNEGACIFCLSECTQFLHLTSDIGKNIIYTIIYNIIIIVLQRYTALFQLCNHEVWGIMTWQQHSGCECVCVCVCVCVFCEVIKQEWELLRYLLKWNEAIFGRWSQKVKEKTEPRAFYLIWWLYGQI